MILALCLSVSTWQLTPAQIRAQVDTWVSNRWAAIQNAQAAYLAQHGRYFQGLRTHTVRPNDGLETPPDVGDNKPTDQAERWSDVFPLPTTMPARLTMSVYHGPQGHGFEVVASVRIGLEVWRRIAQVGPETFRARPWHRVTEGT